MEKILDLITEKMRQAFSDAGYDPAFGRVTVSNRPDLCEYQCNGALAAAKQYKCAPIQIAKAVAEKLDARDFDMVEAVMPGFLNLKLSGSFLKAYLGQMRANEDFGVVKTGAGKTIVVDYGGPNVAKPLHIGHLRSAIIGESLKRLYKFFGYHAIGDIHLGDWGLQMGLIIAELKRRQPELPYFDPDYTGVDAMAATGQSAFRVLPGIVRAGGSIRLDFARRPGTLPLVSIVSPDGVVVRRARPDASGRIGLPARLGSGVYFVSTQQGGKTQTARFVVK